GWVAWGVAVGGRLGGRAGGGRGELARRGVLAVDRGAHLAHEVTELRLERLVALPTLLALAVTLECGGVPSHGRCAYHAPPGRSNSGAPRGCGRVLGVTPEPVALGVVEVGEASPGRRGRGLDVVDAGREAVGRFAQDELGRHVQVPRDAREREQDVPELPSGRFPIAGGEGGGELAPLGVELAEHCVHTGPVEAHVGELVADLLRVRER